jgi:16S rRNA (uracil1498-N3)-methyltransferase
MNRYFGKIIDNNVTLDEDDLFHLTKVLRARIGDKIEVVINCACAVYEISSLNPFQLNFVEDVWFNSELENDVSLFYCLSKGDKIDFVIQKATELGVKEIVLFDSKYSVVKYDEKDIAKKLKRFNEIAKGAAEQSHRLIIPEVKGVYRFSDIDKFLKTHNFLAYEKESQERNNTLQLFQNIKPHESVSILIGSEGGFSEEEVDLLNRKGLINISLGKRILRTETAAVSALSQLNLVLESK